MRKTMIPLALMAAIVTTSSYGFGIPKVPGLGGGASASGGSSVTGDAVDKFVSLGTDSSAKINQARDTLAIAFTKKEDRAKLFQQLDQMKKGLADKDNKKAKDDYAKFQQSNDAVINTNLANGEAEKRLSEMGTDQVEKVGKSVLLLAHGILIQKEQIPAGQDMITAISSNPMLATKLPAVKDTVMTMTDNVKTAGAYLIKLPGLLKTAKVNITLPTDSSSKPDTNVDASAFLDTPKGGS